MPQWVPKESLLAMAGRELGPSSWLEIDQDRIDRFAEATLDRQFIHVDPDRAAGTPFGGTIAHGFLSLSLLPHLSEEHAVAPEGTTMAINYGLNKVRFLQPVRAGSRVRLHSKIVAVDEKAGGRVLVRGEASLEIEGQTKPALVAETLFMYFVEEKR